MFRNKDFENLINFCNQEVYQGPSYTYAARSHIHREEIRKLAMFLINRDQKLWQSRVDKSNIDFYTNDHNFYKMLSENFQDVLVHCFEPDESVKNLLDQPSTIVTKKYPHNRFKYRVYLLPHKMAGDKEEKKKYLKWLKAQEPRVTCTSSIEKWFMKTDWNWDRRYILVEDEKTLMFIKLKNPEILGRVYNFAISDK
jgi:hypothetical protein